jgi:hypothetical protein
MLNLKTKSATNLELISKKLAKLVEDFVPVQQGAGLRENKIGKLINNMTQSLNNSTNSENKMQNYTTNLQKLTTLSPYAPGYDQLEMEVEEKSEDNITKILKALTLLYNELEKSDKTPVNNKPKQETEPRQEPEPDRFEQLIRENYVADQDGRFPQTDVHFRINPPIPNDPKQIIKDKVAKLSVINNDPKQIIKDKLAKLSVINNFDPERDVIKSQQAKNDKMDKFSKKVIFDPEFDVIKPVQKLTRKTQTEEKEMTNSQAQTENKQTAEFNTQTEQPDLFDYKNILPNIKSHDDMYNYSTEFINQYEEKLKNRGLNPKTKRKSIANPDSGNKRRTNNSFNFNNSVNETQNNESLYQMNLSDSKIGDQSSMPHLFMDQSMDTSQFYTPTNNNESKIQLESNTPTTSQKQPISSKKTLMTPSNSVKSAMKKEPKGIIKEMQRNTAFKKLNYNIPSEQHLLSSNNSVKPTNTPQSHKKSTTVSRSLAPTYLSNISGRPSIKSANLIDSPPRTEVQPSTSGYLSNVASRPAMKSLNGVDENKINATAKKLTKLNKHLKL